jgi:predicted DCC family thiol-disulfide oxidoreductase YuxK
MKRPAWLGTWFAVDPRALGLFRIALGLLTLYDVLRRVPYATMFYSNQGLFPNHWLLYSTKGDHALSLMLGLSTPAQAIAFFIATMLCLLAFTVGWHTRLFHVLSAIGILSIHGRIPLTENGGDVVLNLWWLWTLALPLGRRFSLDAVRRSLAARPDKGAGALNLRGTPSISPVWSLSILAVLLQYTVIYFFNTVHKTGPDWMDGSALWWVFEQDRITRGLGVWMLDTLPPSVGRALTWGTLVVEGIAPILLLTPLLTRWARRAFIVLLGALHIGIWATVDVGLFSPNMLVAYLLLLSAQDLDLLGKLSARFAGAPLQVWYDSDCGVCHLVSRWLVRFDGFTRLKFYGREPDAPIPPGWTLEQLAEAREDSIITADPQGRVRTRAGAVGAILDALPFGRLLSWPFKLPGLSALLGQAYHAFGVRRHRVSVWMGLGVCGLGPAGANISAAPPETGPQRLVRQLGHGLLVAITAYGLTCAGSQLLIENQWLKTRISHQQPRWARDFIHAGRFFQGWRMFAPDAPRTDGWLVLDFTLPDGTHVDPQTGEAPLFEPADRSTRPAPGQFWGEYSWRIANRGRSNIRRFLKDWLKNRKLPHLLLPANTGYTKAEVWWIGDTSPDPTDRTAKPIETDRVKLVSVKLSKLRKPRR